MHQQDSLSHQTFDPLKWKNEALFRLLITYRVHMQIQKQKTFHCKTNTFISESKIGNMCDLLIIDVVLKIFMGTRLNHCKK